MGTIISTTVGYGVILPWGDEDDFDFSAGFYDPFREDENVDRYEALEHVCTKYLRLSFVSSYYYDYTSAYALLVSSSAETGYGVTPVMFEPGVRFGRYNDELIQLREACELLGVEYEPTWLAMVSCG